MPAPKKKARKAPQPSKKVEDVQKKCYAPSKGQLVIARQNAITLLSLSNASALLNLIFFLRREGHVPSKTRNQ